MFAFAHNEKLLLRSSVVKHRVSQQSSRIPKGLRSESVRAVSYAHDMVLKQASLTFSSSCALASNQACVMTCPSMLLVAHIFFIAQAP